MTNEQVLNQKLEQIQTMDVYTQQERYSDLFGCECTQTNLLFLRKRVAYKLQEIYLGGISEEDRKILNRLADQDPLASLKNVGKKTSRIGVRLRKFWKGKNYDVIIRAGNQYEYDGKLYRSLSAIASVITGTHWNGKKFFGVK